MIVSQHALQRWIERINPAATTDDALAAISAAETVIDKAAAFGAPVVRLGCGAKLVLRGDVVTTVYPRGWICAQVRRAG